MKVMQALNRASGTSDWDNVVIVNCFLLNELKHRSTKRDMTQLKFIKGLNLFILQ